MGGILTTTPPTDIESERALLGCILADPSVLDIARDTLKSPEDFWDSRHATVYGAMLWLAEHNNRVDSILLTGKLLDMGVYENIGWADYQFQVIDSVPGASTAQTYADRVAEKALRRRVIQHHEDTLATLYNSDKPTDRLLDSAVGGLMDIKPSRMVNEGHISHWLDESLEDDRPKIPCGMRAVDDIVGGFELGTITIIGARPGQGKTAWAVSTALNMTVVGTPVGFVSAEMVGRRVARRLVCADAGISTHEYERDKHTEAVRRVIDQQRSLPLWVDQTPGIHIDKVCSRIRRWKREHDIQVAFADYLQLFSGDGDSEFERITNATRRLQAVAKETDVAVFALAQVNRAAMQRKDITPTLSDLKGSGEIEQAADVVLLLHRAAAYADGADVMDGKVRDDEAKIIVAKNRDGETGNADVGWLGRSGVFSSGGAVKTPSAATRGRWGVNGL